MSEPERTWQLPEDRKKLTRKQVAEIFLHQDGRCPICGQRLQVKGHTPVEFIDEHLSPLWRQGSNDLKNRALVCKPCASTKTAKEATERGKSNRIRDKHINATRPKSRPIPGSKASGIRKKFDGTVERRS